MKHVLLLFCTDQHQVLVEVCFIPEQWEAVAINQHQHNLAGQITLAQHVSQTLDHVLGGDSIHVFGLDPDDWCVVGEAQLPRGKVYVEELVAQAGFSSAHGVAKFFMKEAQYRRPIFTNLCTPSINLKLD